MIDGPRPDRTSSQLDFLPRFPIRRLTLAALIPSPGFSQVFILKGVKVVCFDTDLQVFILNVLASRNSGPAKALSG